MFTAAETCDHCACCSVNKTQSVLREWYVVDVTSGETTAGALNVPTLCDMKTSHARQ